MRSPHFLLHYRIQSPDENCGARLGLVIAKRLLARAVDRNLIRRLARENFRLMRCALEKKDFVLRLTNRPERLDRRALAEEIRGLLKKTTFTTR